MAAVPPDSLATRLVRRVAAGLVSALLLAGAAFAAGPPQRIISLIPSTTEMLFAMGAGSRVIAVGTYDHFPAAVEKLPRVGALLDPNTERILTMKPDLVVLYGTQAELETTLDRAHIPFYAYQHQGLPDITQTIRELGSRVGSSAQANALADRIDRQLADIRTRTAPLDHPKTLLVFGREPGSLRNIDASGGVGFLHDMLATAGGTDALGDMRQQSVMMSTEMVLSRAPDVIIEVRAAGDAGAKNDLSAWNALSSVPAVRNHRVYSLVGDEFVVPGPRVVTAVQRLERTLHP